MVPIELYFGIVLVVFVSEHGRTSAHFAQANHSRRSKYYRNSFLVLGRASRSGDQFSC